MSTYIMFTLDEACTFVEEKLRVNNPRERRTSDRLGLLDDVIAGMQLHIPFNNVHMLSCAPEERRRPTLDEIKADMLSGAGGICYTLITASHYLLKALGYDVSFSLARWLVHNHLVVYARNVERPGDVYLVDPGCAYTTFRAVSLDFDLESPVYRDSFIEYKFVRRGGEILRIHGKGDSKNRDGMNADDAVYVDGWRRCYSMDPSRETKNIEDYSETFDKVYTDPDVTPFLQTFRCLGYKGKRAVYISNEKILKENNTGEMEMIPIEGGDEGILAAVERYYPAVPQDRARRALARWRATRSRSKMWSDEGDTRDVE